MQDPKDASLDIRAYFESSQDLYCELRKNGEFIYVNHAWTSILGYEASELIGRHFETFLHPDDRADSHQSMKVPTAHYPNFFHNRYRHKNGAYLTLSWSGNVDNKFNIVYGHARDVTDVTKKADLLRRVAAIQSLYIRYGTNKRGLFDEILRELLKAMDSDHGFIAEIRQIAPLERSRIDVYAATSKFADVQNLADVANDSIESGEHTLSPTYCTIPLHYQSEFIGIIVAFGRAGGYDSEFLARLTPLVEATAAIVGLFQATIRESALRERFMVIAENLPMMLTEFGPQGRITWANRYFREKLGLTEAEIAADDRLPQLLSEEEKRARTFMLSGRTDWEEFTLFNSKGESFQSIWTNVRLNDGRAIGIGQDLTDRRAAEAMMIQSSKMASLGEMSAGVSHEINNPLAIIQGSAFRAIQNLFESTGINGSQKRDEVEGDLNRIIQNCDRIARIVRGLRAFSRSVDHEPFLPTPLLSVIDDVLNLAHERFKSQNISLNIQIEEDFVIDCRPIQLGQVLMNLLNNAYDAVCELRDRNRSVWLHASISGENIQISVEDSGPGIPSNVQSRILEPFFTTKDVGKGTGLGLSISKGIVESHSGRLWLDTKSKRTRFVIELPLHQTVSENGL